MLENHLDPLKNTNRDNKAASVKKGNLGTPEEELIKDRLMLAEIYLFDFSQPDSAMFQYMDVLERDTTEANISKAIYSIGYEVSYKIVRMTCNIIRDRPGTPAVGSQDTICILRGRSGGATICLSLRSSDFM